MQGLKTIVAGVVGVGAINTLATQARTKKMKNNLYDLQKNRKDTTILLAKNQPTSKLQFKPNGMKLSMDEFNRNH